MIESLKDSEPKLYAELTDMLGEFISDTLLCKYNFDKHSVICVDQKILDRISPPKTYPNPKFNISKINTILSLIELHKKCGNPRCPLSDTKRLEKLLNRFVKNPSTISVKYIERIIIILKTRDKKLKTVYSDACYNCHCNCRNQCEESFSELQEDNKCFEMMENEFKQNTKTPAIGLYLTSSYYIDGNSFKKGSILLSNDIPLGSDTFKLTYLHESTHALLDYLFGSKVHMKKGFDEGFAVAMEYYYADEHGLDFNKERHGEYSAHEMLTLPHKISNLKTMIESVKGKF